LSLVPDRRERGLLDTSTIIDLEEIDVSVLPMSIAVSAHGRVFASVTAAGRKARGARAVDLLIAATALSAQLPLYTRNGEDIRALEELIEVFEV
jgi:predicted nucleic acid-binding protein